MVGDTAKGHLVLHTAKEHFEGGGQQVVEASHDVVEVGDPVHELVDGHRQCLSMTGEVFRFLDDY